ncbi:MAG: PPC domain-containing protein [Isosphaeraceae bacterium]
MSRPSRPRWKRPIGIVDAVLIAGLTGQAPCPAKPLTLTGLFPPGAARGQTVAIEAAGTFDHWPVRAWVDGPGVAIRAEKGKGKLSAIVAPDAAPGLRWVRLYDDEGASELRPFIVGALPETIEVEPNDEPKAAHRLNRSSMTVNGRLAKSGNVDGFAVALERGQTMVASVEAAGRLGSTMDAVLQVVAPGGSVLTQNDDDVGPDPRIIFEAPASGRYIVRLFAFPSKPDSSIRFAGGGDYVYRLTLTTGGFLDYAFPLAVGPDGPATVEAIGWNLPRAGSLRLPPPDGRDVFEVASGSLSGQAEVRRVPCPATVEAEPNDPAHPQAIASPVAISGRIDPPDDRDAFRLSLKKGEKRVIRVESRALGRPLDPVLRILDAAGKVVAESDDGSRNDRDSERSFTAPADGDYRLVVRDLHGRGGPRFAYLLTVSGPRPDFELSLAADRFDLTPGKTTKVKVAVKRVDSLSEPIEIIAEGLPAGVKATTMTSKSGDASARSVELEFSGGDGPSSGPFRIIGRTTKDPRTVHRATAPIAGFEARTDRPWLTVHGNGDGQKEPAAKK